MSDDLHVTSSVVIPASELEWTAVRSSGPGGQNVNKLNTKIDLRFDLPATRALSAAAKARLRQLAAGRLDAEGRVVIVSQATRNQQRNLEDARQRLAALIRVALRPPRPRRPTKPSKGAKRRRLESKRRTAEKKRLRKRVLD